MSNGTFPECEKLVGRLGEICRGEVLTPLKCNHYRAIWGLGPLPGAEPVELPIKPQRMGFLARAVSAARVLSRTTASAVRTGRAFVSSVVRTERFAICQTCEHLVKGNCELCTCACNNKNNFTNKLAHASSECPIKKWGPVE